MTGIPPDILGDLLSRLPVKDILRFRSVSKQWYSLIDSHHFIYNFHMYRSLQKTTPNLSFIYTNRHTLFSTPLHTLFDQTQINNINYTNNLFDSFPPDSKPLASSNGLLLLGNYKIHRKLGICNLSTREYFELPSSNCYTHLGGHFFLIEEYGFAYDSLNDDYKVVRINQFRNLDLKIHSEVEIYSLKLNKWRRVECILLFAIENIRFGGVFSCGSLHWVGQQMLGPKPHRRVILGFNIWAEEFIFIPQPDYNYEISLMKVGSLEGRLCLSICGDGYSDIYIMRDYGVKESWIKFLSMNRKPWCEIYRPLDYSKNGNEILLNKNGGDLVVYDLGKDSEEVLYGYSSFDFEICVESLVRICDYRANGKKKLPPIKQEGNEPRHKKSAFFAKFFSKKFFSVS